MGGPVKDPRWSDGGPGRILEGTGEARRGSHVSRIWALEREVRKLSEDLERVGVWDLADLRAEVRSLRAEEPPAWAREVYTASIANMTWEQYREMTRRLDRSRSRWDKLVTRANATWGNLRGSRGKSGGPAPTPPPSSSWTEWGKRGTRSGDPGGGDG